MSHSNELAVESGKLGHQEHHGPSYGLFILIWIALIGLTSLTVGVAGIDLGIYTVGVALAIACIKAGLVVLYFMHLKFDTPLVKYLVGGCGLIFIGIILCLGLDVIFY
jgi:cytochrome c oxidase subunit IV